MKKLCVFCGQDSEYIIQWGPTSNHKQYVCGDHIKKQLDRIRVNEMYIVKVEKTD